MSDESEEDKTAPLVHQPAPIVAQTNPIAVRLITIDQQRLVTAGFVESGRKRFIATVRDYSDSLLERAVRNADHDKAPDCDREVGHDHVGQAARSLMRASPKRSGWLIFSQACEYVFTACAGAGAGHLDKNMGIVAFALGTALTVILLTVRIATSKSE